MAVQRRITSVTMAICMMVVMGTCAQRSTILKGTCVLEPESNESVRTQVRVDGNTTGASNSLGIENLENAIEELKARTTALEEALSIQGNTTKTGNVNEGYGESRDLPGSSCKDIQQKRSGDENLKSGTYWIRFSSTYTVEMFCDMDTYGGGWTLVWTYGFKQPTHFSSDSNYVIPRPNWNTRMYETEIAGDISVTPPKDITTPGALSFPLWKSIGQEFLVTSNINNWYSCKPNGGNLVEMEFGPISCHLVKVQVKMCADRGAVPYRLVKGNCGPALSGSGNFYYYEGCGYDGRGTTAPAHDPCGAGIIYLYVSYLDKFQIEAQGHIFIR
ncbi:unnamed protein product [Owenia fusiformis]|uniref:Uncharacterized protein n=1 Tax=Owenia fusiformis TaxID=6347 RepID=A0A8J1UMG0_OWEFU|nr:unnamed protein product [Owenia fusiformis]